jgi:hypothetical protein
MRVKMSAGTNRIITPLIAAFVLLMSIPTFAGKIIYVDDDGPADFNNIQAAINYSSHGDTIIVAEGRYFENINFNGRNITLTSTDPCNPDVVAATIIDGSQNGSVVTFNNGEDANCILNGFTITKGYAEYGGGIYCEASSPTITNCIITVNSATWGGGMFNSESSPTLINCTFSGNSADDGGGTLNLQSSPILTNCTLNENSAILGGGMSNWESSSTITNCAFNGNSTSKSGGGMFNAGIWISQSSPTITNCTFNGNLASLNGGGMCNSHSSPTITNCMFIANSARSGGGMLNTKNCSPTIIVCKFIENRAENNHVGGGMFNSNSASPIISNCLFAGNSAGYGGAIYNRVCYPTLTNCAISNNSAIRDCGGILSNGSSHPRLINCILWGNKDSDGMDESGQIYGDNPNLPLIDYCCIQSWTGSLGGEGNIDADPCFVAPGYLDVNGVWVEGDYHLLPDSPCINAGDPSHLFDPNEIDLDGKPRVIGCRIDMGAFEYSNLIPAEVRIVPHTINLANKSKWITAFLLLPENYNVAEIDFCILLLEYKIEPQQFFINEKENVIMARFNHEQLQGILKIGDVELLITSQLTDGYTFEGTDLIKVIYEGGGKLAKYGKAGNPNPPDGATNVDIDADLNWTADYHATSHDLYFGMSNPPPLIGNQTDTTFDPALMDYETTYYWRIDEINKWGITIGDIWRFTTMKPPRLPPPPPPGPPPPPAP